MMLAMIVFGLAWVVIFSIYVLFPLLLAGLARVFGRSHISQRRELTGSSDASDVEIDSRSWPRVAMVVAAFNEENVLAEKLLNTWRIDYPADRFELWIGLDGCDDNSEEIVLECSDPRLRIRNYKQRRGKISVLNDLLSEIDADVIVMSDANTMYASDAVKELAVHFDDPHVGCVSGELGLTQEGGVSGEGLYWKYEGWIKRSESSLGFLIGCNGGIFALRRECYEPLPASTIVEDFVLTLRILERRYQVRFAPQARATEPACSTARDEMVRKIRIGAGGFQALGLTYRLLMPQFGLVALAFWGHKVLRWFVPFFFAAALIANLFLYSIPAFAVFLGLQAAGALIALAAYHSAAGKPLPRWTRPVSYFYLMNYSLLCGFFRFLSKTQRVTWDRLAQPAPTRVSVNSPLRWQNDFQRDLVD